MVLSLLSIVVAVVAAADMSIDNVGCIVVGNGIVLRFVVEMLM